MPATLGVPICLLSLQEALQDQQVGLTQAFFRLLPLCWLLEHVRFCLCLLGAMFSCNPSALQYTSPTVLKPRFCGSSWLWGRISRLESPTWGLDPLLLGKSVCSFDYPSISGLPTQGCGSYVYTSLLLLLVSLQSLLYFFSWGKALLWDFRLFSSTAAL